MTSGWICDVVFDGVRCGNKKDTDWDLEAPEIGMTFRLNLCASCKTKIMVFGQIDAAIAGADADIIVDAAPMPGVELPSIEGDVAVLDRPIDATCGCMSPGSLYDIRTGTDICPGCRHIVHKFVIPCGVAM